MSQLTRIKSTLSYLSCCLFACVIVSSVVSSFPQHHQHQRSSMFAARRAADDSRPLARFNLQQAESRLDEPAIVTGKFKAPAPERIFTHRIPKSSNFAARTLSASYRVADSDDSSLASPSQPEKVVHGIVGASTQNQGQKLNSIQRQVGAKIQVSDEGLNYPPSKLSADIYGNVAEIVTAPPEAVENDFLIPQSNRFSGSQNSNRLRSN